MIILQRVQMLNDYVVHLKPMECHMSIILQLKRKRACGHEFRTPHFRDEEMETSKCLLIKNKYIKAETDETHFPRPQIQHSPLRHDASLGGKGNSEASKRENTEHKR